MPTTRLKSKICLVGDRAVGKTSLVRRYVFDEFDDRYLSTLGTKVSRKEVEITLADGGVLRVDMGIWDIMGQEGFRDRLKDAYFAGAHGILAVADITARATLAGIPAWISSVRSVAGEVPLVLVLNKADLAEQAAFGDTDMAFMARNLKCGYLRTSARTGENVEEAFLRLARVVAGHQLRIA